MAYQALYRRFRPKSFDEVLGQEHITTTLKNQIVSDNIAHAYLFSGTRGTGKTSTAKIFARAVNCLNTEDGNPCNECDACKGIYDESVMDIIEMDAASNNSVDDIRELRENVKYPPSKCRYKVYIIDEVHMLSKGAFNALLKTLEEPPKHLIFILATTEPQKLPATILSRCQRYDFKRITVNDIVENMKNICNELGVKVEEKALHLIARNSDGAMRDALSILDQCVSFAESEITYDYVISALGIVNNDLIFNVTDSIIDNRADKALEIVDKIVQNGKDVHQFIKDLIAHFRNLMVVKTSENVESIIDGSIEYIGQLQEQSQKIELNKIITFLSILSEAETQSKWSSQPRIILEVSIIKMINTSSITSIDSLIDRISYIEESINSGALITRQTEATPNRSTKKKINTINRETTAKPESIKANEENTIKKEISKENKEEIHNKEVTDNDVSENIVQTDVDMTEILDEWESVLKEIKSEKISLYALIMEGRPVNFKNNVLSIAFEEGYAFHREAVDKPDNKIFIQNLLSKYFKTKIEVKFVMATDKLSSQGKEEKQVLIDKAISIFGEDVVEIEE